MAEFVRDQVQPAYIQYLPLIVFAIIVIIQILYYIFALANYQCGRNDVMQNNNNTAMVIGVIIAIIILIVLIYIIYVLCQQGWNLSAWFLVVVLLILSVLFSIPQRHRHNDQINLNVV